MAPHLINLYYTRYTP